MTLSIAVRTEELLASISQFLPKDITFHRNPCGGLLWRKYSAGTGTLENGYEVKLEDRPILRTRIIDLPEEELHDAIKIVTKIMSAAEDMRKGKP